MAGIRETIKARNQYTTWVIDQQTSGKPTKPFNQWLVENFRPAQKAEKEKSILGGK